MIEIEFLGYFADLTGYKKVTIKMRKGKVKDLLEFFPKMLEVPRENIIVLVNGIAAKLETDVKEGDKVAVMPPIGGG